MLTWYIVVYGDHHISSNHPFSYLRTGDDGLDHNKLRFYKQFKGSWYHLVLCADDVKYETHSQLLFCSNSWPAIGLQPTSLLQAWRLVTPAKPTDTE